MPTAAPLAISPLNSEYLVVGYSFKLYPVIIAGDTISPSPSPVVEQVSFPAGQPILNFGPPVVINNGTAVAFYVSVVGGVEGTEYETICTVWTVGGQRLKCRGNYVLTAMS